MTGQILAGWRSGWRSGWLETLSADSVQTVHLVVQTHGLGRGDMPLNSTPRPWASFAWSSLDYLPLCRICSALLCPLSLPALSSRILCTACACVHTEWGWSADSYSNWRSSTPLLCSVAPLVSQLDAQFLAESEFLKTVHPASLSPRPLTNQLVFIPCITLRRTEIVTCNSGVSLV